MRIKITCVGTLLGATAIAAAIAAAPSAAADPGSATTPSQQSCTANASGTLCQSPGNTQINNAPPPVQYYPYGGEAFLL
jgi:hypothetical protein